MTSELRVLTIEDLRKEVAAHAAAMDAIFSYDPGTDVLTINVSYPYEIELGRISNNVELLQWTLLLCDKPWMDTDKLAEFISRVCVAKDWDLRDA